MSKELVVHEAMKATPATANIGLTLLGVPLQSWVMVASLVLIFLQIFFLIKNNVGKRKHEEDDSGPRGSDGTRRGGDAR